MLSILATCLLAPSLYSQEPVKYTDMNELIAVEAWKDYSYVPPITKYIDQHEQPGQREFSEAVARINKGRR